MPWRSTRAANVYIAWIDGTASCQGTSVNNCKILQYRGEVPATGAISGNTITIESA